MLKFEKKKNCILKNLFLTYQLVDQSAQLQSVNQNKTYVDSFLPFPMWAVVYLQFLNQTNR